MKNNFDSICLVCSTNHIKTNSNELSFSLSPVITAFQKSTSLCSSRKKLHHIRISWIVKFVHREVLWCPSASFPHNFLLMHETLNNTGQVQICPLKFLNNQKILYLCKIIFNVSLNVLAFKHSVDGLHSNNITGVGKGNDSDR